MNEEPAAQRRTEEIPPEATSDEIVKRLVVDELYWDSGVDASQVFVEVSDGVVTLTGRVPTVADRYAAEDDARRVRDVAVVENRIQIEHPADVTDRKLRDSIRKVLEWAPDIDTADVEVAVEQGIVKLQGTVRRYWERVRAHRLAARVPGVRHVIDELVVTPTEHIDDREIAHYLTRTLEEQLGTDLGSIRVTVQDGEVALRGSVPNQADYQAVRAAAEQTRGVVGVRNELAVRPRRR